MIREGLRRAFAGAMAVLPFQERGMQPLAWLHRSEDPRGNMPELPEVEVTRLGLVEAMQGAYLTAVRLGKPLRWPLGCSPEGLVGRRVRALGRRGKYLLLELDEGVLLVHLGMSGSLRLLQGDPPMGPHDHVDLVTDRGTLRLHDPRRFGAVVYAPGLDQSPARDLLARLEVEPLTPDFEPVAFARALRSRRAPIKQVLLAGQVVVGVGNIYASEALFRARIRPTVRADRLGPTRALRLHAAIREVLAQAVALGGSSLRDFTAADGQSGYFQLEAHVYGRAGQPCRVCATPVRHLVQGQRSTYFCPTCQRP